MKHKTWFRLVLKAIGILIIATNIPTVITFGWTILVDYQKGAGLWTWDSWLAGSVIGHAAGVGIGVYLLFGGEWLLNQIIPSNRRYCPDCGYDVSESPSATKCSECGVLLPRDDEMVTDDQA